MPEQITSSIPAPGSTPNLQRFGGVQAVKGRFFQMLKSCVLRAASVSEIQSLEERVRVPLLKIAQGEFTVDDMHLNFDQFQRLCASLSMRIDDILGPPQLTGRASGKPVPVFTVGDEAMCRSRTVQLSESTELTLGAMEELSELLR